MLWSNTTDAHESSLRLIYDTVANIAAQLPRLSFIPRCLIIARSSLYLTLPSTYFVPSGWIRWTRRS